MSFLAAAIGLGWSLGRTGFLAPATGIQQQIWPTLVERGMEARQIEADWRDACRWIAANTPENSLFLTPTHQQTFKWFAARAEVVTRKDVPQDARGLIAWWTRRMEVYVLKPWPWDQPEELANLVRQYGVTHIVWPRGEEIEDPPGAELLFNNHAFGVYRLEDATRSQSSALPGPA